MTNASALSEKKLPLKVVNLHMKSFFLSFILAWYIFVGVKVAFPEVDLQMIGGMSMTVFFVAMLSIQMAYATVPKTPNVCVNINQETSQVAVQLNNFHLCCCCMFLSMFWIKSSNVSISFQNTHIFLLIIMRVFLHRKKTALFSVHKS